MRLRIEQLLNGSFEYESSTLRLSVSGIALKVNAGDRVRGSFEVSSSADKRMKGFLYSSDPRMSFEPQQFQGRHCTITYFAETAGLKAGAEVTGEFVICSDQGEAVLPWRITVADLFLGTDGYETAKAVSLEELAALARKDMHAAADLFADPEYAGILKESDRIRYNQYQALMEANGPIRALEEYLISRGIKEPVDVNLEETEVSFPRPERSQMCSVTLRKQGWGYQELTVSSDARFLRPQKNRLTTLDFVGDTFSLEYVIDTNFLHAGRNFGRISISSCYRTIFLEILVEGRAKEGYLRNVRVRKLMQHKMLSLYLDFRMNRIDMNSWIDRSRTVISSYRRAGGNDVFAELFLVQMLYAEGKQMKGRRMLTEIGKQTDRFQTPEQYAYYLYLTTFFERDAEYVDQVETRIEQMFLQKRDNWVLSWILLYLQERYLHDDAAKLEAISLQVRYGCSSPIMYLEAASILRKDPYVLRKLGDVEKKILLFAAKYHLLTEELALQTGNLVNPEAVYDPLLMRILEECYDVTSSRDILRLICSILIANGHRSRKDFPWFELGVANELRINGLYDSYMETMDEVSIEKMPQIIRMYFSYNSSLNYHKKAAIYRNISDNRESVPSVYRANRPKIEYFISEQLELGRIDSNLEVLYERFLTKRLLTRSMALQLAKVLFTFRVVCKNPNMKSVIVAHDCLKKEEVTPLKNGVAKVQIYTPQARIFLADEEGHRYTSPSLYMAHRYMDSPLLTSYVRELAGDHFGMILYTCSDGERITAETLPSFVTACGMEELQDWYLEKLRQKVLVYYVQHPGTDSLYDFLRSIRFSDYISAGKRELVSLLTQEGMYEEAFHLVERYGPEEVDPPCLVRICSQNVLICEYEENPFLLSCCFLCYRYGKYDDNILEYLLSYYEGPIEEMKRLWETGHRNDSDTMALEEKILSLLLFMRSGGDNTEQIFWSYYRKMGRKKLCRAYVNLKCYEYFVKNLPVGASVFSFIEQNMAAGKEQLDVCKLALLQYYSALPKLDAERTKLAKSLLEQYNARGMRFDFFRKFPADVRSRCSLDDRVFLEYVADPSHTAAVYYRNAGSSDPYRREMMKNCFEGIFVREFILFEGEQLECYIEEYNGDEKVRTLDPRTLRMHRLSDAPQDRFAILSRMSGEMAEGDREKVVQDLNSYLQTQYLVREVFTMV